MRILLIAEQANPQWVSVPLEGWCHSRAIGRLVRAHTVTQVRNRDAFLAAGVAPDEFTAIDSERMARRAYKAADVLRGGQGKGWTAVTAMVSLTYPYFERLVWREFGERIKAREFDVVHRLTPLSPTAPSPLAARCARAGVPFVLGPLNGGVRWPRGFDAARRQEREWLSYVRGMHKLMPGYRSTRRHAAAIIAGSRDTLEQVPRRYREKCVYIPENAVDPARFPRRARPARGPGLLRAAFVGRLVPYKGADMLVEAAAPLIRAGKMMLDVVGDGPEMDRLRGMVEREAIGAGVRLPGWVDHRELRERLVQSDVFAFPSIREFGGGAVLEAMAAGLAPVVVAYGGPAELVTPATGYLVPMSDRAGIVAAFRKVLAELADDPGAAERIGRRAQERVYANFTWDAKAAQVVRVYDWVLGRAEKPDFGMPLPDAEWAPRAAETVVAC